MSLCAKYQTSSNSSTSALSKIVKNSSEKFYLASEPLQGNLLVLAGLIVSSTVLIDLFFSDSLPLVSDDLLVYIVC